MYWSKYIYAYCFSLSQKEIVKNIGIIGRHLIGFKIPFLFYIRMKYFYCVINMVSQVHGFLGFWLRWKICPMFWLFNDMIGMFLFHYHFPRDHSFGFLRYTALSGLVRAWYHFGNFRSRVSMDSWLFFKVHGIFVNAFFYAWLSFKVLRHVFIGYIE